VSKKSKNDIRRTFKTEDKYCEYCGDKLITRREISRMLCDNCRKDGKSAWTGFSQKSNRTYSDRLEDGFALMHQGDFE
jgi:ribosomal protein L37AE/L43A